MLVLLLPLTLCRSEKYVWSATSNEWTSSITGWISFQLIMDLSRNCYMIFEFFIKARACEALVVETTSIHFWNIYLIDTIRQWFIGIYFKFSLFSVIVLCRSPCLFVWVLTYRHILPKYLPVDIGNVPTSKLSTKKVAFLNLWVHHRQ